MTAGSISLGMVAVYTSVLAVACSQCDRVDQYRLKSLIARHGPGFRVPDLLDLLAADCPNHDLCGIHCPQLPGFFLPTAD